VSSEQCIKNAAYLPPPKPKTQPKAARSIFEFPTGSSGDDVDDDYDDDNDSIVFEDFTAPGYKRGRKK
jgi:hypothetical protein